MSVIAQQQHEAEPVLLIQSLHVKLDTFTPNNDFKSSISSLATEIQLDVKLVAFPRCYLTNIGAVHKSHIDDTLTCRA